ncbi:hypothetical protein Tco_0924067 [Tanacetum coccineum]|uniref:Reverse transcriptase domain-containing protein n=1 Tax=Tanacetum coccineum TaxID=301880 RepID=A0ABQ5D518_9ASTR
MLAPRSAKALQEKVLLKLYGIRKLLSVGNGGGVGGGAVVGGEGFWVIGVMGGGRIWDGCGGCMCNTQPNPKGYNPKAYQPPQSRNEHVNAIFIRSGKSYNPSDNPNDQQNNSENPINFNSNDEDDEPTPKPKTQPTKPVKETPLPKPYKPKIPYPQHLRKEKMEAQYGKFLDMIRAVRINVPLIDVLAKMPNYGKFLKELISNKHKIKQISTAFLSDESSAMIQDKVPPKLGDPESFLILCNFNKTFSCNALADLGASINVGF